MCANGGNAGEMENLASYLCSLYGAPEDDGDIFFSWSQGAYTWENWGADYYTGNNSQNGMDPMMTMGMYSEVQSVEVYIYDTNDIAMDWNVESSMDSTCIDQTMALAVKCSATDFCLESGESCATDLDCCQDPNDPMYCQPSWGMCIHTV